MRFRLDPGDTTGVWDHSDLLPEHAFEVEVGTTVRVHAWRDDSRWTCAYASDIQKAVVASEPFERGAAHTFALVPHHDLNMSFASAWRAELASSFLVIVYPPSAPTFAPEGGVTTERDTVRLRAHAGRFGERRVSLSRATDAWKFTLEAGDYRVEVWALDSGQSGPLHSQGVSIEDGDVLVAL